MSTYLDNLTIDGLIEHLEEMKRRGASGAQRIVVEVFQAPTPAADDRPDFPRAQWRSYGRVVGGADVRTLVAGGLYVVMDGEQ